MPLINLCVDGAADDEEALSWGRKAAKKKARTVPPEKPLFSGAADDFHIRTIVHRRLGDEVDPGIMAIINDPHRDILVLFPSDDAVSLDEGMKEIERRRKERGEKAEQVNANAGTNDGVDENKQEKIVVMFLDATWKYAQEMERANTKGNWWPKNIIRVKLSPPSQSEKAEEGEEGVAPNTDSGDTTATNVPIDFKPQRFNIRTPPSSGHLSTAECLAWVCAAIEDDPLIYETLMRPIDFMVEKWKSFSPDGRGRGKSNFLDGDGVFGAQDDKKGDEVRRGREEEEEKQSRGGKRRNKFTKQQQKSRSR